MTEFGYFPHPDAEPDPDGGSEVEDAEAQAEKVGPQPILIEENWFQAHVLPLYHMPGLQVVEIMGTPDEGMKTARMVSLLQLAMVEKDADKVGLLTMKELNNVVNQWVEKSGQEEAKEEYFAQKRRDREHRGFYR